MHRFLVTIFIWSVIASNSYSSEKPNVIVILVDDMGFSDLGCYGSEIPTPNIDALAAGGVKFSQFYNNARCCPTRASLLTGVSPHQAGIGHMAGADQQLPGYLGRLSDRCITTAQVLQPAGYFTAMVGKWHVGNEPGSNPWERGFERSLNAVAGGFYLPDSSKAKLFLNGQPVPSRGGELPQDWYSSDLWTTTSLKFIDEARVANKPFYLYLAENAPHFPLQAPADEIAKFRGQYKVGWDKLRSARFAKQKSLGLIDATWPLAPRPPEIAAWDSLTPEQQNRFDHLMAVYAACVTRMDRAVGDLVAGLKQRGVLDDTLILFMSDNGGNAESGPNGRDNGEPNDASSDWFCGESWASLQNTPFRRYKHYTHEGGISTPLIAHWPAAIQARSEWITTPTHLIDILPTLADFGAATYPKEYAGKPLAELEGISLKPLLLSATSPSVRSLFWEHEGNAAVREGDLKLVRQGSSGTWELYNLKTDRTEQHDLAALQPQKVIELSAQWQQWAETHHVLPQPVLATQSESSATQKKPRKGKSKVKSNAANGTSSLFQPTPAAAKDPKIPLPPLDLPDAEKLVVLELKKDAPTHFRFQPRKNETIPASISRFTASNGTRNYEAVLTVLGPNQNLPMTFRNEMFLLDAKRMGYRWDKGETEANDDRVTMVGSTGFWFVFPPVLEFKEEAQPVLNQLRSIDITHRDVRYEVSNHKHSEPSFDVNKWDFVYDFNITGFGEIIVALAGDMKGPDRGVEAIQTEPIDATIVTDRFGNRLRYESHTPQKGGGHFHLVCAVDAEGIVITRPEKIPDRVDILPVVRHVIRSWTRRDDDPSNDLKDQTLPPKYRLGPMLIGSEVWDQTRGSITLDRSLDMDCVLKARP